MSSVKIFYAIFGFPFVFFSLPWKYPKNCPWKNELHTWKFPANRIRENGTAVREKYVQIKKSFYWKISFKYQILPVKRRNFIRENPRKLFISYPWKKNSSVKNSLKVSVKILDCPWKVGKKCAWKPVLYPWKNPEKGPKMAFTGTFDFHGKKITLYLIADF